MIDYTLWIDISGGKDPDGYFQINAISVDPFKEQQVDGMLTTRYSWGNVLVKNEPYKFAKLGESRYKLYEILKSVSVNQEIHIKFISQYQTIEGYFGLVDCKLNDDRKVITISPTILDQYTAFIDNRENDVELFKENNVIVNGKFDEGTNNAPQSWVFSGWTKSSDYLFLEKKYIDNKSAIAISDNLELRELIEYINPTTGLKEYRFSEFPDEPLSLYQSVQSIIKNRQIKLSFYYGLGGIYTDQKYNLKYRITLYDPTNPLIRYGLIDKGVGDLTWTAPLPLLTPVPTITYNPIKKNKFPIGSVSLTQYARTIAKAPISGTIKIEFFRFESSSWEEDTKLLLQDVSLSASAIELKTIRIEFPSDNLVTFDQSAPEIYWGGKKDADKYFRRTPNNARDITDYINEDGNPLSDSKLNNRDWGITSEGNRTYSELTTFFQDRNSKSYKFELSELTVYKGHFRQGNRRNWYATAKFSREQVTTYDILDPTVVYPNIATYIPVKPADGVGWEDMGHQDGEPANSRLWVRTPFNGGVNTWTLGEVVTLDTFSTSEYGFDYIQSITTKKNYPISANKTREITNAVDLRDIITKLYQGADPSLLGKQVRSSFLWNDTQNTEITKILGLNNKNNYYTGLANELKNIAVIHTFDLKNTVNSDDKNTYYVVSPKKFMDDLFNVYLPQCYWFIDNQGNLNIEHISFFDRVNTAKSLLDVKYNYIGEYNSWEYAKDKLFALEEYSTTNSGYPDFKASKVTFDKIATNKRGETIKGTYSSSVISTDIRYCSENSESTDSSLVLIAYSNDNGVNKVRYGSGQKTNSSVINGELSLSTLLAKYADYEGTWIEGLINDKGNNPNGKQTFRFTKRVKQGKEIEIKGIFLDRVILTNLGRGVINSRTIDYTNEKTTITAYYRHFEKLMVVKDGNLIDYNGEDIIIKELPSIQLLSVTKIDIDGFKADAKILYDGNDTITERGLCYSNSQTPTIDNDKLIYGSGDNLFSLNAQDLPNYYSTYYVRAYAINSVGISYSNQVSILLNVQPSTVSLPSNITVLATEGFTTTHFAQMWGNVGNDGGGLITERGFWFSDSPDPVNTGYQIVSGSTSINFYADNEAETDSVLPNTTYYICAYATNSAGTAYSSVTTILTTNF